MIALRSAGRVTLCLALGVIMALTGTIGKMALAQDDVETRNRRAVQTGFDNWRNGTGSIFDLLAPDAKWTIVGHSAASKTFQSEQDFIDNVIKPFNARLSSRLIPMVRGVYADGDTVVVLAR